MPRTEILSDRTTVCSNGRPACQAYDQPQRCVYIAFDQDANHAGQHASRLLAQLLENAGVKARIIVLPEGQDPNSYFIAGATASDFRACMERAQSL